MPVILPPHLRGLLLSALLWVPVTAAWAEPTRTPQEPETASIAAPQQADTMRDCSADARDDASATATENRDCPEATDSLQQRIATTVSIASNLTDKQYRQAYPNGYAQQQTVADRQRQAQHAWQLRSRHASHPEGIGQPEALFTEAPFAFLDWYPNLTGTSPLSHCGGSYIQPSFDFTDAALQANEQPVHISADYSRTLNNEFTELTGNVYLRKGNRQVRSQQARVDHRNETAELKGLVQFRDLDLLLLGERAEVNMASNEAVIEQAQFLFHSAHLRGSAEKINRLNEQEIVITQGEYTRCPPGDQSWSIRGSEILLNQDSGLGEITHATLRLNDIPILYAPYLSFPIDGRRISGLLVPKFSLTTDNGFDFAQPYYFNLAPNYDDTLTLRHIGERGEMVENEFRYRGSRGQFELGMAYLPDDDMRNGEDRWILGFNHSGSPSTNWTTRVDYTSASDGNYFEDLGTDLNLSEQSHLDQQASVNYRSRHFNFDALVHDYQTIDDADSPYRKLPALKLSGNPALYRDWILLDYLASYSNFNRNPSSFVGNAQTTGSRFHLETTLKLRFERPWGYIRPGLRLTHTQYKLQNTPAVDDTPSRTLPLLSIDTGLLFDRYFDYAGEAYTQTLEPRLFFLDVPFQNQAELPEFDSSELTFGFNQLFRDNRFSGLDRIGDTRQTTVGLTTRLLDSKGYERGNASIGQIYYDVDRKVRLSTTDPIITESNSNIVAEGLWNVTDQLRLSADAEWDRNASTNLVRNFKVAYRSDIDHLLSFGYRFTKDELEQTDLTMIWPLSTQWSMLGRWQQDILGNEAQDLIAGLEYENCCWQVRSVYRQWITDDQVSRKKEGLFLQFVLKGLGGIGTRAAGDSGPLAKNFLKEISGFEEHRDNDQPH